MRSFANLQANEEFDIPAECHFQRTSHGKGARNSIEANIKRQAIR